jgi:AcrR family transcriptional regulator
MKQSVSVPQKSAIPRPGARGRPLKRAEQQRAVETRLAILNAALAEFAEKGFDAASIRTIANRTELQHPLITYHFRTKDILWRATAEYVFSRIREEWDGLEKTNAGMSALDRLRAEYRTLFRYTVAFPEFHRFMRQECTTNNPRLRWVAKIVVTPLINRLLPQIAVLQKAKLLPLMEPIVFHYMMVSLTAMLAEFGPEMTVTSKLAADDPFVVESYWRAVDRTIFGKSVSRPSAEGAKNRAG